MITKGKKIKVAVIHFLPLEYYPPIINFLNTVSKEDVSILVLSCHNNLGRKIYANEEKSIERFPFPKPGQRGLIRLFNYLLFNIGAFMKLIFYRPDKIFYYESYSSFPAYMYLKIFRKTKLFIHFHEYFDKEWYVKGMKLVQLFHRFEVSFLFKKARWISQTNQYRLDLFYNDYPFLDKKNLAIVPNYPPQSWQTKIQIKKENAPVKLVYIGALSFEKTYIKEVVEWVENNEGKIALDIFSYNLKSDVKIFLTKTRLKYITYRESGVEYDQIPILLKNYNVGLILYKGVTANYRFNETNKLFEYLACNLDVWFPEELQGVYPHITERAYPKVLKLNFNNLVQIDVDKTLNKTDLNYKPSTAFAETAFGKLIDQLTKG